MKTSSATINIVQLTKADRSGLYPIVLRAHWHGLAEKRTGVSVPQGVWNKQSRRIRPSYPNSTFLNNTIVAMYNEALERKLQLEREGPIKDVHDIFGTGTICSKLDYNVLMEDLIAKRSLSYSSAIKLRYSYNTLCRFMGRKDFRITDLNMDTVASYGRWLKGQGLMNGSITNLLYDISNVWTHAISQRLVDSTTNPYISFSPKLIYPSEEKKRAITESQLDDIRYRLQELIFQHHQDKTMDVFSDIHSDEFTLAMFTLGYYFGGLALVDMANLRKDQLQVKREGKVNYYIFRNVKRQKTNRPVPIIVKHDLITRPLMEYYMSTDGDYLFPINDHTGSDAEQHKRMNTVARTINRHLRTITGLDITFYVCRHSYASIYLNTEGSNPLSLSVMMGRSPAGIFRYVKTIQSDEDIIRERARMGL